MKKIAFTSRMQFAFCVVGSLMSVASSIAAFYNPYHILLCTMWIIFTIGCYKERNW